MQAETLAADSAPAIQEGDRSGYLEWIMGLLHSSPIFRLCIRVGLARVLVRAVKPLATHLGYLACDCLDCCCNAFVARTDSNP